MAITLRQFKLSFNQLQEQIEEVQVDDINILWFDDFYDGMLCGMLEYKNQKCRFEIVTDYKKGIRPRVFAIVELLEEQIADEAYWHKLFLRYVISDKEGETQRPRSEHHLFYEPYKKRPNPHYERCNVKAWFVEN